MTRKPPQTWACEHCGTLQENRSRPCTNCGAPSPGQKELLATAIREGYTNVERMLRKDIDSTPAGFANTEIIK